MGVSRRTAVLSATGALLTAAGCSSKDSSDQVVTAKAPTTTPGTTATASKGGGSVPVSLKIPSIGFDEKLVGMGLTSQGTISPEPGVTQWYNATVAPGKTGISVIAGHVTWNGKPDVFVKLDKVNVGDQLTVGFADGSTKAFKVTREKSVDKVALQKDQTVWGNSTKPVLALITCDSASRVEGVHHVNNYVVWAEPV